MKEKIFLQAINANYRILFLITILIMPSHFVLAANMEEFYPLHQGNTWVYAVTEDGVENKETLKIKGVEEIGGIETARLFHGENKYVCLAFDSQGIKEYKDNDDGEDAIPQPPVIIIPNIEIGGEAAYSANFICNGLDNEKTPEAKVSIHIKLKSIENVMVPAGKFSDCLKFSSVYAWENPDGSREEENIVFWLARGIGKVKEVCVSTEYDYENQGIRISNETRSLISAIINGKKIGGR